MQKIFHSIGSIIATGLLAIGSLFSPVHAPVGAAIPVSTAVFQTSLASSIAATDTSMSLVTGINKAGNPLSGYTCFNIDEGTSIEEFMCGTASGASVTGLIRGIDPVDGDLSDTSLKKGHSRGASVKITDYPSIAILSRILNGDETVPNTIKYTGSNTCASASDLCPKSYVDGIVVAGGVDASTATKGISKLSVSPVSPTNPISVGDNDPRIPTVSASSLTAGQLAALPGDNTDIAVGSGNKYVTQTGFQKNAEKYASSTTGSSAYVATLSPAPISYTAGMVVYLRPDNESGVDQEQTTVNTTTPTGGAGTDVYVAQSFINVNPNLSGLGIYKSADTGSYSSLMTITLEADSAGAPSGTPLATVTISNDTWLALPVGFNYLNFASPYTATPGSTYWIKFNVGVSDGSNHPNIGTNSAGGYANGSVVHSSNGSTWSAIATIDLAFKVLTSQTTLNVNALGIKNITKEVSTPLSNGDIASNQPVTLIYDGTNFVLQSPVTSQGLGSWLTVTHPISFRAPTDGFMVVAFSVTSISTACTATLKSDGAATPTVVRGVISLGAVNQGSTMTIPIRKGDYASISTAGSGSTTLTTQWIPTGV